MFTEAERTSKNMIEPCKTIYIYMLSNHPENLKYNIFHLFVARKSMLVNMTKLNVEWSVHKTLS